MSLLSKSKPGYRPGNSDGLVAHGRGSLYDVASLVQVHVAAGRCGGLLAIIDDLAPAVWPSDEHEAAAAEISGRGPYHGERQPYRHGSVNRVTPRCMISTPTREAISLVEATMPCRALTGC